MRQSGTMYAWKRDNKCVEKACLRDKICVEKKQNEENE